MNALPPGLRANPRLSRWLSIRADGRVEVRSGKVELGQGIHTAQAQIVADALGVSPSQVEMIAPSTAWSPNEGVTSGSLSVQESGNALRAACTEARRLFVEQAAVELGIAADRLRVDAGRILAPDGRSVTYASLATRVSLDRDATAAAAPGFGAAQCGTNAPRLDLPRKVFGPAGYVHDMELAGMLHGRVLRPPSPGAQLDSIDESRARSLPGVAAVVRSGRFIGVLAEREDVALKALERLHAGARWSEHETLPDQASLADWIVSRPVETTVIDESGPEQGGASRLKGRFTRAFTAHASIGPACAVAQWNAGRLHVWTHAQGLFNQRADLALAFGIPAEHVVVEHREGAGCYGHNGADDVALDAALLARAAEGRPVKVVWSREDELSWAPFGPAMVIDIDAALDDAGEIVEWRSDVWSNGHGTRPGRGKHPVLLAASHIEDGFEPPMGVNAPLASGGGAERNAVPAYGIATRRIRNHRLLEMPIRTSALRSLGAFANVFAIESVVDDVAAARGEDPVAWRLRHLADPRARDVIEAAARLAGWSSRARKAEGIGHGVGFARYKQAAAYCAVIAEVQAEREIRVRRLWIAVDVGFAVNPDGVANQVEGGAIQAASWTVKEAVRFDRTRITSGAWETYPILRFSEVPSVQVEVLQRPGEPSVGAGEASMGPTAAAIGNAVFDALGVRVRDLPITPERILAL